MSTNNVNNSQIKCNEESFTISSYMDITIIIRDSDGYVNITQMVNEINKLTCKSKKLRNYLFTADYKELLEAVNEEIKLDKVTPEIGRQSTYVLNNKYTGELRGTYAHPLLVNSIAMWADKRYAIKVNKIMNNINELHLTNKLIDPKITTDETFARINEKLKLENEKLTFQNIDLIESNKKLKQHIKLTSVPIETANKKLYIIKITDNLCQLCANSNKRIKDYVEMYSVPAGMNLKQFLKDNTKYDKDLRKNYTFDVSELDNMKTKINDKISEKE